MTPGFLSLASAAPSHRYVPGWLSLVLLGVALVVAGTLVIEPLTAALRSTRRRTGRSVALDEPPPGGSSVAVLDLDTATVEELVALPGIGPVLARRIIDMRTARGCPVNVEDLRSVAGIGTRRHRVLSSALRRG